MRLHIIIILIIYIISFIINALNGHEWYLGLIGGLILSVIYAWLVIFYNYLSEQIERNKQ